MNDQAVDTPSGLQAVADRHGVSLDAVRHVLHALEAGNGTMAQFNHPDLGGFGQWSSGGMIMIGQMFDQDLKARVASLCEDLARSLPPGGWSEAGSRAWWPAGLGRPSTSGSQGGLRYAYFPESRRLAVETDGALSLYDTGDHVIGGVSQAQGGSRTLRFTGSNGEVDLDRLKRVEGPAPEIPSPEPQPFLPEPITPEPIKPPDANSWSVPSQPVAAPSSAGGDVLDTLEKLAGLHARGVLTDAEFAAKKAELLARL